MNLRVAWMVGVTIVAFAPTLSTSAVRASTSPTATPPPQIYHIVTRPLCSELHERIAPAIGMMLQNDKTIAKSPDIFKEYNFAMGYGSQGSQDMAVMRMENLVVLTGAGTSVRSISSAR